MDRLIEPLHEFHHQRTRWLGDESCTEFPQEPETLPSEASAFTEAMFKLFEVIEERKREFALLDSLKARVANLEARVSELSKPGSVIVPITTFAPEPFELLKEIKVVVRHSDDEFVASFFDANVNASGCNMTAAVDSLKGILLRRFEYLDKLPIDKIGPALVKQITILRTFIRKRA